MSSLTKNFFTCVLLWTSCFSESLLDEKVQKFCPKNCECDVVRNYRRADCSDTNLINTFAGVPEAVEILDLSRNKIALIDDHSFKEYTNIIELDLSRNSLDTLALRAFEPMQHLQKLDLSYNRIEQLDNRLFELNRKLTSLDLTGNKFWSLSDHAFVKSVSLENLIMSDCKLSHISHFTFHAVPNLKSLDLSHNLLRVLHVQSFVKMKKLGEVNLEDNVWDCNDEMFKVLRWFKKHRVDVKRNQCYKPKKSVAGFEKIVDATTESPKVSIPIELLWNVTRNFVFPAVTEATPPSSPYKILTDMCSEGEIDEVDHECTIDACKSNLTELYENYKDLTTQIETYKLNHLEAIIAMCYVGLFFGALGGGLLVYLCCFLRDQNIKKTFSEPMERQRLRKAYKNRSQYAHASSSRTPENATSDSEAEGPRIASPISPSRIPSFRNSIEPTIPKSLTPLRHSQTEQNPEHSLYQRRQVTRNPQEQELPTFLKYFRRSQRPSNIRTSLSPTQRHLNNRNERDTYFLPSPTTSNHPRTLQSVPSDPGHGHALPPTRQLSNAVSNTSVIYNEIDEASQIPQDVCCTSHIRREIDALTVDLLRDANTTRVSNTPPPPYIDCMSVNRISQRNDTQFPQPGMN